MTRSSSWLGIARVCSVALLCGACAATASNKPTSMVASDRDAAPHPSSEPSAGPPASPSASPSAATADAGRAPEATRDGPRERAQRVFSESTEARDVDAEVLALLDTVDRAQIEQGMQARSRAADPRVRALAERLMIEHAEATARRARLVERLGARAQESARSQRVSADSNATLVRLGRRRGAAFDRAYLSAVAEQHAQNLDLIDRLVLPAVTAPALRELLVSDARPSYARHLERIEALRVELEHR